LATANESRVVHVIEHALTDTVVDVGPKGDSRGDLLAFANPVFDPSDKKQVGTDSGNCIRTDPGKLFECNWTTFLDGGQITVEGPFFDSGADSTLSIIGGTGIYRNAHGQMTLHARGNPVGSEFDFIFSLN
jgi:allene oxide cyclase